MDLPDRRWAEEVARWCDPVFGAADVGFERQVLYADERQERIDALLWEADPALFAARYPDSGLEESYGAQWPDVHCVDYWVYVETAQRRCRLSVEGWDLPELSVPLHGHAVLDGSALSRVLARILAVPAPPR